MLSHVHLHDYPDSYTNHYTTGVGYTKFGVGYVAAVVSKIRLSRSLRKNQLSTEINHFIKNVWLQLQLLRKSICFLAWHNQKTANVRLSTCNLFVAMVVESIDLSLTSWSVNGSKM
ncbi:hypothetical protein Hanom_Chr03g00185711 [Helianthus anomalus]